MFFIPAFSFARFNTSIADFDAEKPVGKIALPTILFLSDIITAFVVIDPTSIPAKYNSILKNS